MRRYIELEVWKKAVQLAVEVCLLVNDFPKREQFGISSQISRSAVSVPSNIAEGAGRNSTKEFHQFLGIATGSLYELETQLLIAGKLSYLKQEEYESLQKQIDVITKMIVKLKQSLSF